VGSEIDRHFKQVINRPELLNRMGENIIVFDFIREGIAVEIFEAMLAGTLKDVASRDIAIQISDGARRELRKLCLADLSNGGRGIRNKVEAHLVNPLARAMFDKGIEPGGRAVIAAIKSGRITELELRG
jgi:ATP-dependent Clp protease ATP-binding subunit ClpA